MNHEECAKSSCDRSPVTWMSALQCPDVAMVASISSACMLSQSGRALGLSAGKRSCAHRSRPSPSIDRV